MLRRLSALALFFGSVAAVACGSASSPGDQISGGDVSPTGAAGSSSSTGGASGQGGVSSGGAGGATSSCSSSGCAANETCSSLGHCIATGTCESDGDCASGTTCDATTKTCVPIAGCGSQKIDASRVPSNLLVVLDRSCSMTKALATGETKWQAAAKAIDALTTTYADSLRFGLTMFPLRTGPECDSSKEPIPIPIGDGNGPKIADLLMKAQTKGDANFPDGPCVTPIDAGVKQASKDPALKDGVHPSYLLLVTDGKQAGCSVFGGASGAQMLVAKLAAQSIDTFVVGFGGGADPTELNALANAGGKPASGANQFYAAEDEASLTKVFEQIAGQAIGCVFDLASTPPDPSKLYVFFDDAPVSRDATHATGWDYDATKNRVTVYGASCDMLKAGAVMNVDIVFGCNAPPMH